LQKQLMTFTQQLKNRKTAANSRLPQWGLTWLNQVQCFYQHLCLVDSEVLRNRHLRVALTVMPNPNRTTPPTTNEQKSIDKNANASQN
jgi:hypothetical protein